MNLETREKDESLQSKDIEINMKKQKKKSSTAAKIVICVFTLINVILSIIVRIYDRKEIIKAISDDDKVKAIIVKEKTTKTV